MSRQELSYFDAAPQWLASNHATRPQQGATVNESLPSRSMDLVTYGIDTESDCESGALVVQRKLRVPAERMQAFEDHHIIQQNEMSKLESQLNRTTVLCTSLFCINIAISVVMLVKFMSK
ncbi:hypothetical protein FGADI_5995 [Fusarium gaditjirri]|uniref:Uncharacterized protein n=1 Tax=Fusarium gaditjirri TaxID=282569 RepID=A0A8H4WXP6_9HYPO|nr:hypothetical protein FGADI_5995 [Fusarium gaditjirri]